MIEHLAAILGQLADKDRCKFVLDAPLEHLAAGGDDRKLLLMEGQHVQDRLRTRCGLHCIHLFLFDHQRDDPGTGQLCALFHGKVAVDGGDHHLGRPVDGQQCLAVDLEQAVAVGDQLDLSLPRRSAVDVPPRRRFVQQSRSFVLVEDARRFLPDIEIFLADAQQHRDVLGLDDVPLAEPRPLELARNDLGDVMAKHLPHGILRPNQFHTFFPPGSKKALEAEYFIIFQCFWLCSCVVIPGDPPALGCDMR